MWWHTHLLFPIATNHSKRPQLAFKACKHVFHRFMEHTAVPRKHRLDQISNVGKERLAIAGVSPQPRDSVGHSAELLMLWR
jgi:hypothetical protein